jgi:transcriptional regulator with XRE-family HTH domain
MESMVVGISEVKTMQRPAMPVVVQEEVSSEGKQKAVYDLSDDQRDLRDIRISLGMTKQSFSSALNVKQCTLDSYEYGKTKGVPKDLMDKARKLASDRGEMMSSSRILFDDKPMSSILGEWAEKLNIPMDNSAALSRLLNTTPTTIRRWRENKVRPDLNKLTKLAERVNQGPIGAQKISAIYALKKLRSDSAESKGLVFIPDSALNTALSRVKEVKGTSDDLASLIIDFEAVIGTCNVIPGNPAFIQMNALVLHGFVRKFLGHLAIEGLDETLIGDEE